MLVLFGEFQTRFLVACGKEGLFDSLFRNHSDIMEGSPNSIHGDPVLLLSIKAPSCFDSRRQLATVDQYSQKQRVSVSHLSWSASFRLAPSNGQLFGHFIDRGFGNSCLLSDLVSGLVLVQKTKDSFDS